MNSFDKYRTNAKFFVDVWSAVLRTSHFGQSVSQNINFLLLIKLWPYTLHKIEEIIQDKIFT